jgi:uncharacterized membrane protein YdjX (TVP38/TMEM64 family)
VKKISRKAWLRLAAGLLLVLGVVSAVRFSPLQSYLTFDGIVRTVEQARLNAWSLPIFYFFFVLAVLGLPVTLFPIIGGVLFGFWLALPLNILACTLGATIAFYITRFFGRGAVETLLKGRLKMLDRMASYEGVKTVVILRLLGIPPFLVANYAMGLSAIKLRHFVLGTVIGIAPWMALITFASHALWDAILVGGKKGFTMALLRIMGPITLLSVGIIATMGILYVLRKRRNTLAAD